jgi:hypothetical protein
MRQAGAQNRGIETIDEFGTSPNSLAGEGQHVDDGNYSPLMLAALMIGHHFLISAARKAASASGVS